MVIRDRHSDRIRMESAAQWNGLARSCGILMGDIREARPSFTAIGGELERKGAGLTVIGGRVVESPDNEVRDLVSLRQNESEDWVRGASGEIITYPTGGAGRPCPCLLYTSPSPRD